MVDTAMQTVDTHLKLDFHGCFQTRLGYLADWRPGPTLSCSVLEKARFAPGHEA